MPAKNAIKIYSPDTFYHLYNRGVEKRIIYVDDQDKSVFLSYLKTYLLPQDKIKLDQILLSKESLPKEKNSALKLLHLKNFADEIELHCFALMSNHFHLLVRQKNENSIEHFLRALGTRYSLYFNKKYRRVGPLFQGVYKAVMIENDNQLLHLSRYIHTNPLKIGTLFSQPTSLPEYLSQRQTAWVKTNSILSYFNKNNSKNSYENFIGEQIDAEFVAPLAIDFTDE